MISNSSPLIFLSKIGELNLLKELFRDVFIPSSVKEEVLNEDKKDSIAIREAIDKGWIKIENSEKELPLGLDKGENAALSLAKEKKDSLIIDDALGIKAAKSFNINIMRTTSIVFLALSKKLVSKEKALKLINLLIDEGYYITPRYYKDILNKLK